MSADSSAQDEAGSNQLEKDSEWGGGQLAGSRWQCEARFYIYSDFPTFEFAGGHDSRPQMGCARVHRHRSSVVEIFCPVAVPWPSVALVGVSRPPQMGCDSNKAIGSRAQENVHPMFLKGPPP